MAETTPDHDRIVTLEARVEDLRSWRKELTAHLDNRFDAINIKFDATDAKTAARFDTMEVKLERQVDDLRSHVDTGFEHLENNVMGVVERVRMAMPIWAQIAIVSLVGLLGAAVTWAALGGHP